MNFPQVPMAWLIAMSKVSAVTGMPCILSGGALRDLVLGRPVKDLDISLPYSEEVFKDALDGFSHYPKSQHIAAGAAGYIDGMCECKAVLGFDLPGIPPLNLVFLRDDIPMSALEVAGRNDFGICQIACNSNGHIEVTEAFLKDADNKTFTVTRPDDGDRCLRRFERLSEKYPGYVFVPFDDGPVPLA